MINNVIYDPFSNISVDVQSGSIFSEPVEHNYARLNKTKVEANVPKKNIFSTCHSSKIIQNHPEYICIYLFLFHCYLFVLIMLPTQTCMQQ